MLLKKSATRDQRATIGSGGTNFLNRSCTVARRFESILLREPSQNPFSTASTQSGHGQGLSSCRFEPLRCPVLSVGGGNAAARFHQNYCRLSSSVSGCGPRTAARPHAAHRRTFGRG